MAIYSMCLRDIYLDKNYNLFDFNYPFYDEELKKSFETKFFDLYLFDEIAQETPGRFKQRLKNRLIIIMPYYIELYNTIIASQKVDFLLNKDLKETYIKEVENNSILNSNVTSNGNSENVNTSIYSDTPQGTIEDINNYMSSANKNNTDNNYKDNNISESNNSTKGKETTEFISQGNIGVTSSAELLNKWRETIINIDELILNDLQDLFLQIY